MLPAINNHYPSERTGIDKIMYEKHLKRIEECLPTIDMTTPAVNKFFETKWKNDYETKIKRIEDENKIILKRLLNASNKTNIDNTLPSRVIEFRNFKKQLYHNNKRLRFEKITKENNELLKRIINVDPIYKFTGTC